MAQTSLTVRGVIQDTAGVPLSKATIRLISPKDTLISISEKDGSFIFVDLPDRKLELLITMKGYVNRRKNIFFEKRHKMLDLGAIVLQIDYRELDPVIVKRIRPITIGEDTISYHAAAFAVREGSEVEALLKRLPGVEVDMTGNVIVQGKKIGRVLVNGKDFFGGDVLTATRNLPADIVDMIQVIDDYGDKARLTGIKSGESAKVLNIVLKEDKRNGQFGQAQVSGGNEGKYTGNISENIFKSERQMSATGSLENNSPAGSDFVRNAGLNYADRWSKKWTGGGSGSISGADPVSKGSVVQDNYYTGGQLHQEQITQSKGNNSGNNLSATFRYIPDAFHTLRISPTFSLQQSGQTVSSISSTLQQDSGFTKTTNGNSINQGKSRNMSVGSEIYYEQLSTHSKRRFSLQINGQYANTQQNNDNLTNTLMLSNGISSQSLLHYLVNNSGFTRTLNATANYFSPLGKAGFLELSYNYSSSLTQNNKTTQQPDSSNSNPTLIDSLSDQYSYQSITQRLHAGYSAKWGEVNLSIGLDGQPGSMSGTIAGKGSTIPYHYFSFLPVAEFSWPISRTRTLSFHYSANPELPSLHQLQPLTDNTNPQYPVTGNPLLKPAYAQSLNLHYEQSSLKATQFQNFGVSLGYNSTANTILADILHPKDTGPIIQETTYLNAGSIHGYHGEYHFNLPALFQKRLRVTYTGNIDYSQAVAMTDRILYYTDSRAWTQSLHIQYILPDIFESDLSGSYNSTHTSYPSSNTPSVSFSSAEWSLNNRHYLGRKWILNYALSQAFNSNGSQGLHTNPVFFTAALQRQFFKNNRATFSLAGFDLFNSNAGISQSVSATSVTRSQTILLGRYFMCSFLWKWGKFGQ